MQDLIYIIREGESQLNGKEGKSEMSAVDSFFKKRPVDNLIHTHNPPQKKSSV